MNYVLLLSINTLIANAAAAEVDLNLSLAPASGPELRLINAIVTADYDNAVVQTLQLRRQSKGNTIRDAVDRLIRDSKRNLLDYAFKLWFNDNKDIVKEYFPVQFRQILSSNAVKIIGVRDNLAIKLGYALDSDNDRTAYGDANDKTSENISWKFVPLWDDSKVYFKIVHVNRHQNLKLSANADSDGDHSVYGDDVADTHRHQWYLKPAYLDDKVVFFIYNRKFNQALKLGRAVDSDGDRQVYSNNGGVAGLPDLFGWSILAFN